MKKRITHWVAVQLSVVAVFVGGAPARLESARRRWQSKARVGTNSTEIVLLVIGGIIIAGLVVAAVTAFVNGKIPLIK